ncbi:hypothetical protein [Thauera sp.]|uniref:hypothetical protein n=1 Tax=Thauera sp. TaxID=1905334 RepID=UPI002CAF954E|nr:hypothetical protein [Thauera sp.]HRP26041.1 hypothetical protein [Thauera sp.]
MTAGQINRVLHAINALADHAREDGLEYWQILAILQASCLHHFASMSDETGEAITTCAAQIAATITGTERLH